MANKKTATVQIGRNETNPGLRIGVQTAQTGLEAAERALTDLYAERDARLADATGEIARRMVQDAAAPIIEQRQKAVGAAQNTLTNRVSRLHQAEADAARSTDPVHVRYAELVAIRLREIVAGVPDYLGTLTVIPVSATQQHHYLSFRVDSQHNNGYGYGGTVRIVATDSGVSAYTWRAVMAWALQGFGDQRNDRAEHWAAQVSYSDDFAVELDGVMFIDREAEREALQKIDAEHAEAARLAAMGYSAHDAARGGDR